MSEEIEKLNLPIEVISNILKGNNAESIKLVLQYVLLLSEKDVQQLYKDTLIQDILVFVTKNNNKNGQLALDSIINITGLEDGSVFIVENKYLDYFVKFCLNKDSILSDQACKILSNITRYEKLAVEVYKRFNDRMDDLVHAISNKSYNTTGQRLEYLSQVFGNMTQSVDFQNKLVDPSNDYLTKVLPVLHSGFTLTERRGIASALYNCLFDQKSHMDLLNPPFEILPVLLLPLAGPEEFDEEDYDKMPLDLQYLPDDKQREPDSHVRNLLLRSLLLLCSSKPCRTFVRDHNTYYILREYHKWENDKVNLLAVENVIDILIRTEDEIGIDDLSSLNVPDDLKEKFEKWDNDFINGD